MTPNENVLVMAYLAIGDAVPPLFPVVPLVSLVSAMDFSMGRTADPSPD
jgi:hypothetical protein